ncbi:MAG: NAD-dependent epimerase/dehydratase family protein [Gemmatimonadota bacterium]
MPRVGVTGASGFLARALEARLAGRHEVRGLFRAPGERSEAWESRGHGVVLGDLDDGSALAALVDGCDVVYHLAARTGKDDLAASRRVNVGGTENVARAARAAGVRRLIYVSSISVYAATRTADHTVTEDVSPANVPLLNPYSRTKHEAEVALRALAERGECPGFTTVRPTNVYGPWARSWFLDWARRLARLPVAIGGDIPVDLVHADDVADGLVLAAEADAARGEVLHLGHESVLLGEFARRVGRVIGRDVRRLPAPLDRVARTVLDRAHRVAKGSRRSMSLTWPVRYPHDRAERLIGYRPRISLDEGFRDLDRWYREVWLPRGADSRVR